MATPPTAVEFLEQVPEFDQADPALVDSMIRSAEIILGEGVSGFYVGDKYKQAVIYKAADLLARCQFAQPMLRSADRSTVYVDILQAITSTIPRRPIVLNGKNDLFVSVSDKTVTQAEALTPTVEGFLEKLPEFGRIETSYIGAMLNAALAMLGDNARGFYVYKYELAVYYLMADLLCRSQFGSQFRQNGTKVPSVYYEVFEAINKTIPRRPIVLNDGVNISVPLDELPKEVTIANVLSGLDNVVNGLDNVVQTVVL